MKKYISLFVVLLVVFAVAGVVRAEDTGRESPSRSGVQWREEMKTRREVFLSSLKSSRETFLAELKSRKEEWKTTRAELKKMFCQKVEEIITRRFEVVIAQLERFQGKVGEIIDKLESDGKDTTLAEEALDLSRAKLADAKAKLAETKGLVPDDCSDMTPELFGKIKLGIREAKDLLKESREALHQAIQEIKNLRVEDAQDNDENGGEETQ
ncbi:hypothetical protein A3A95_03295 [Candidatus Nomurabacteria bacterium RIFCSPLOWO2_01_FULL_39_18]|uniref:Uncharacterized protein n=1 Tax=Candidatus Nomurabacteria bacterium RIFCSPHIGHO2_01_FULL_40_24b TaxID=1801739 RepID=A0A1F6V6L0_9BACT|nr:MAG: hypothetical protein A2647_05130 [Candidatus Nomurabacteria bacterium RIFCSPHIGHO2_01_FULL_40_24b]OGI89112.1 MAG: hypothetical protein A3A95_03295 [Candidatus Nomurabacteria bacterium RIFCSPLOWO2_01_FULL_39_18]